MNDPTRTPQPARVGPWGTWCECTGIRLQFDVYPAICSLCSRRIEPKPPTPVEPHKPTTDELAGLWAPVNATEQEVERRARIRDAMDKASKRKPRNNRGRK